MKTVEDICNEMAITVQGLKSKELEPKTAREIINAVGKVISARKGQLEYYEMRNEIPTIPYFGKAGKLK